MSKKNITQNAIQIIILLLITVSSFGSVIEISVETEIHKKGTLSKGKITLRYSSSERFAGFDVGLQYNAAILKFADVKLGSEISHYEMVKSDFSAGDGMIDAVDYSLSGVEGEGDLLHFYFDIVAGSTDSDVIQAMDNIWIHDVRFCDVKGDDLPVALNRELNYGIVFGTVMDIIIGEPISNATIQVDGADSTTTNAEGKYSVELPAGTYTIGAVAEGYVLLEKTIEVPGNGSKMQVDFLLYPESIVFGTVMDILTGEAIPNATIQVDGTDSTSTNAEGKYSLQLPAGTYIIGAIVEGYVPLEKTIEVPRNSSKMQVDFLLYPKGDIPKVCDVVSRYCGEEREKAYFLNGISVNLKFKAIVDWGEHEPGLIHFITPKDSYIGTTNTRTFDIGTEFGVGGQLQVIAVSEDGTKSEPYTANFEVVPIPPGIPNSSILLKPKTEWNSGGHVLKYGSSKGWKFTAIDEGVGEGIVPGDIPGFGGKAFKFLVEADYGVEITSEGEANAWVTKPTKKFKIAEREFEPEMTAKILWKYSSSKKHWVLGAGIDICVTLADIEFKTAPHYFTIQAGPIPIPAYWRAGIEASLDTCVELIGWLSEFSPKLEGNIRFKVFGKFILGVGIADVLAAEGELKGGPDLTLQFPMEPHLASLIIHIEGTARVVILCFKWSPGSITYDWRLIGGDSAAIQAMRLKTLPALEDFEPLERNYLNEGYPMFVGNEAHEILSYRGNIFNVFSPENTIVINEYPYSDPDLSIQNGKRILVWLTDDPHRSDNNRTKALWSIDENEGWAEPMAIDDDGTADFEPDVELLSDGSALAAWVNCSQIFDDSANLVDLVSACEIKVAKYDSSSEIWESSQMTNNFYLEHTPHLSVADDGTAMLVWISNPSNHIIGSSTETNQIWYSFFNGTEWSLPALIADGIGAILKSDFAYDGKWENIWEFR